MIATIYGLCAIAAAACAVLLVRAFARTRVRLLFWAAVCFAFLAANNVLLFLDLVVLPTVDLSLWRALTGAVGACALLYGILADAQ
jgi:hypothetical protein